MKAGPAYYTLELQTNFVLIKVDIKFNVKVKHLFSSLCLVIQQFSNKHNDKRTAI